MKHFLLLVASSLLVADQSVHAATPYTHKWDTVAQSMSMHGKYKIVPAQKDLAFVANNYATATIGTGCSGTVNKTYTIEMSVWDAARGIKNVNPEIKVGMYWRSDFAMELAQCSGFAGEWAANPQWYLKDDTGKVITHSNGLYLIDYSNPDAAAFFAKVLVNVTKQKFSPGVPLVDFVYIDGDPLIASATTYAPGIGPARSKILFDSMYECFGDIQSQMDAQGYGNVINNGCDTESSLSIHVATGTSGSMFDHWSILQFLSGAAGDFNVNEMDAAFQLVTSALASNVTTQIKGWPGPIVAQKDKYPPNIQPQPNTTANLQKIAGDRFNNELALFLLVASEKDFWIYSWFWSFDDYVPGNSDSSVPMEFFPQAKCALGPPSGPYERIGKSWTYKRQFEKASVFVDLTNRTASKVTFDACDY